LPQFAGTQQVRNLSALKIAFLLLGKSNNA